jgi:hypothetical protein
VKKDLAGLTLTRETFKKEWKGAVRTLTVADFAKAFQQWFCAAKSVLLSAAVTYVEKT